MSGFVGGNGGSTATGTAGTTGAAGATGSTGGVGVTGAAGATDTAGTSGAAGGSTMGAAGRGGSAGGAGASGTPDGGVSTCEVGDAGSATGPSFVDLSVLASGFPEHEGETAFLVTRVAGDQVLGTGSARVTGGAFMFRFPKGYKLSANQEILWLFDEDGDGLCREGDGDHTGYVFVNASDSPPPGGLEVAISDNHARTTSRGFSFCNNTPFGDMLDMDITGIGFDAHNGRTVHLVTRTIANGAVFGSGDATIEGGGFAFHLRKGFQRFTYQEIFFFIDIDGDGRCASETDHTGYVLTPAFTPTMNMPVKMQVMDNHVALSARGASVCAVMNGCQLAP